jgi:hypothetical protein
MDTGTSNKARGRAGQAEEASLCGRGHQFQEITTEVSPLGLCRAQQVDDCELPCQHHLRDCRLAVSPRMGHAAAHLMKLKPCTVAGEELVAPIRPAAWIAPVNYSRFLASGRANFGRRLGPPSAAPRCCLGPLPLLVRMHPFVGCDRARLGELDHPYRRRRATFPTGPALQ